MADLDHIKDVDNDLTYNIKDATARSDIATIQGDITTIQGDITNLQGDVTTAQGDITNLQGDVSTAQGDITTLQGDVTNLSGDLADKMDKVNPTGSGAFSLNRVPNSVVGDYSVAEGSACEASGNQSHAEGNGATASGVSSHAEGTATVASDVNAHAEGGATIASGINSHAEGSHTEAAGNNQHVSGRYNIVDNNSNYAEIIGNGDDDNNRSNARTLDWQGNETIAGDLIFNGSQSLTNLLAKARYSYKSGESFSQVVFNGLGGYVTTGSTDIWVFVPFAMIEKLPSPLDFSLELVCRTVDGGYPYLYNGSTWQGMNTYVPIITNGTTAAGVTSVVVQNLNSGGFTLNVKFTNTLRTTNGGSTAIKNNAPIAVVARISGTIS